MNKKKDTASRGLFAWFTSRDTRSKSKEGSFLPADVFEAQLNQERARADRSGSSFVVLTFELELNDANAALTTGAERLLADTLLGQLRLCDTKGWHVNGATSVAAILPDTNEFESYTPVRRTESLFQERFKTAFPGATELPQLRCGIHAYPSEGSWGRKGSRKTDSAVQLKKEVFTEAQVAAIPVNGNGHHG
jgi:hypothetical protein